MDTGNDENWTHLIGGFGALSFIRGKQRLRAGTSRWHWIWRESLNKALSPEGNPEFATVLKVVRALGLRLRATTAHT